MIVHLVTMILSRGVDPLTFFQFLSPQTLHLINHVCNTHLPANKLKLCLL